MIQAKSSAFLAALLCALAVARAEAGSAGSSPAIMPVSQVRAGMRGYGLTTLTPAGPQRFDVEVLGTFNWFARGHLIIVRISGPILDEAGIISGMSGSPVYIDGKLLGAVAYGWSFSKVPLAGVTPAEEMAPLVEMDRSPRAGTGADAKIAAWEAFQSRRAELAQMLCAGAQADRAAVRQAAVRAIVAPSLERLAARGMALPPELAGLLPAGVEPTLRPLPLPLTLGGLGADSAALMPVFREAGLIPVQAAGGAGPASGQDFGLEPGAPVCAVLVSGDMDISAGGTMTWLEGDRVVALGHPLFGSGDTNYPLAVGLDPIVLPSLYRSSRITRPGKVVGRITQDREPAVLARLGEEAPMFPCKVRVKGAAEAEFNYRVAGHWELAPVLAFIAIDSSVSRWEGSLSNPATLTARAEIYTSARKEPLVLQNVYTTDSLTPPPIDLVATPMTTLLWNPHQEVQITGVDYSLEVQPGIRAAYIESAWAERPAVEPGARLAVFVRLREHRGGQSVQKLELTVPPTAQPGTRAEVLVCDAQTNRAVEERLDPGFYGPRDLDGLLAALGKVEPNRNLVLRASFVEQGLRLDGAAMPSLPHSALSILQAGTSAGAAEPLTRDVCASVETPWVLRGRISLTINVKDAEPQKP